MFENDFFSSSLIGDFLFVFFFLDYFLSPLPEGEGLGVLSVLSGLGVCLLCIDIVKLVLLVINESVSFGAKVPTSPPLFVGYLVTCAPLLVLFTRAVPGLKEPSVSVD